MIINGIIGLLIQVKFFTCCENIDNLHTEDISFHDNFLWLQDKLLKAIDDSILTENDTPAAIWNFLKKIREQGIDFLLLKKSHKKHDLKKEYSYAVFGCGIIGRNVYKYLLDNKYDIYCFMDNSSSLWGTLINDIPVIRPEELPYFSKNVYFIIANDIYAFDIKQQLISNGIAENMITIWTDSL